MFWFKKSPTVEKSIELKHVSGEKVTIVVKGHNAEHVDYMASRIKKLFVSSGSGGSPTFPDKEFEKVFDEMNDIFGNFDNVMKKTFRKG